MENGALFLTAINSCTARGISPRSMGNANLLGEDTTMTEGF